MESTIIYSIHDAEVGGTQLWMEDHVGVVVTDGLFSVVLGGTVPLSADVLAGHGGGGGGGGSLRYLQVQLSGQPPIMPRTQLVSTPYSVATIRVDGDLVTAPGELHMFNADSAATVDVQAKEESGKKKAKFKAGAELAGSVNRREVSISSDEDSGSITIDEGGVHRLRALSTGSGGGGGTVSLSLSNVCCLDDDSDGDGVPNYGVALHSNDSGNRVAIKTKGTGADANKTAACSAISTIPIVGGLVSRLSCTIDDDSDGDPEISVISSCDSSGASQVMEKKGLNAVNVKLARTISGSSSSLTAMDALDMDSDDDGLMDRSVTSSCDATGAKHAINTKGTGANNAHTRVVSRTFEGGADVDVSADGDGDGHDEATIKFTAQAEDADNAVGCDMGMSVDIDDDGDDECAAEVTTSDKFAQVRGFKVDIAGASRNSFETSCDSAGAKLVLDRDTGRSKGFMRVAPEGPSISLEHEFSQVFDVGTAVDSNADAFEECKRIWNDARPGRQSIRKCPFVSRRQRIG
ncbi:MAG: hypothetical protein IPH59_14165 [bacterium]|nr:hypothetical protein [bacterium]